MLNEKRKQITICVGKNILSHIDEIGKTSGRKRAEIVREALAYYCRPVHEKTNNGEETVNS